MLKAQPTTFALAGDVFAEGEARETRLSMTQATAVVVGLSLALWTMIGFGVHWLLA